MGSRSPRRPTAAGRLFGGGGPRVEDEELLRHQARSTSSGALARAHGGGSGGGGSHPQPPQASRKAADSYAEMGSPALLQNQRLMAGESASDDPAVRSGKRALTGGGPGPGGGGGKQQPGGGGGKKPPAPDDSMAATTSADAELREVYFNYAPGNAVFDRATNVVVTSKYNVVTFLPKFLKESFSKVANFFFLVVCVLQSIKSISNTYGVPTNSPVLLFVISIDAVFAIMEDLRRHQADNEANAAKCHIVRNGRVEDARWSQIKVGDFVQVRNREVIPADVLILAVAEPVGEAASGICYVETKSLDGETNLKLRQAIAPTMSVLVNPQELLQLRGVVKCETPNPYISKFAGKVEVAVGEGCGVEVMPLSAKNVLLRGCNLRNTDWVLGLVLNTGPDTKIMQSSVDAPSKWSDVMLSMNKMIGILCVGLFVACAVAATCYVTWQYDIVRHTWYIQLSDDVRAQPRWQAFVQMLFYYFLLLYQVIPISLYVSMTSVKFLQAKFMVWDREMYHAESDTPALVRTMALNEELGQISYVFSDKTGTLTCNIMEFRKCSIQGVSYGSGLTEIGRAALVRAGKPVPPEPTPEPGATPMQYVNFVDPAFFAAMKGGAGAAQQAHILRFFEHLAVCHTVIPETLETGEVRLSASSPDEQALVAGAAFAGFRFLNRGVGKATIEVFGERQVFDVLDVLEFNSTRKRMSVVVRRPDGELWLYSKGADMMIYQRLRDDPASEPLKHTTREHMEKFADDGLRTLALAVKRLDEKWFLKWKRAFDEAQGSVAEIDRRKDGKPNAIDTLMEEIEDGLELIGATAIEDKLQDGVPQCLATLTAAGIKVWMLTGDKEETAINIAYACSLLDNTIQQVVVNCTTCPSEEAIVARLNAAGREYRERRKADPQLEIALVIDGEALEWGLSERTAPHLLAFAKLCRAVICNRVSPAQKAEMVRLVRDNMPSARTLAIGDGANDVAMIQAAHVGVGISGQEGMQAVNSSDYAIAQFRFLERLLLVHGRWNYMRISKLVLYMFYKNITLVLAQYWYGFLSGASGSKLYWELGVQVYNVAFTGLPIVVVGVMDKDLPAHFSAQFPDLYRKGPERYYFNLYTFFRWVGAALFESLVIFVVMSFGFNASESAPGSESRVEYGMVAFSMTVLIVNLKIWLISDTWTLLALTCWSLSVLSWFGFAALGTQVPFFARLKVSYDEYGAFAPTAWSWGYVLVVLIGCVIALGRHFAYNQYQRTFYPELNQVLSESVEKRQRRLTINHVEEQTLSMSLDDVTSHHHLHHYLSRGSADATATSYQTNSSGLQGNHGDKCDNGDTTTSNSGGGGRSNSGGELDSGVRRPAVRSTVSESVPLTADSFSASVYSASVSEEDEDDGVGAWDRIPPKYLKTTSSSSSGASRRNTGFAFSCDEETTLAESYIASNSLPRSDAVPAALRNSMISRRPSR